MANFLTSNESEVENVENGQRLGAAAILKGGRIECKIKAREQVLNSNWAGRLFSLRPWLSRKVARVLIVHHKVLILLLWFQSLQVVTSLLITVNFINRRN